MVASSGSVIAMEGQPMKTTAAGEPLPGQEQHVSAAESDFDGSGNSSNLPFWISCIAEIMNPRKEDDYNFPVGSHFKVLDGGKSHLKVIHDENKAWKWFLDIP